MMVLCSVLLVVFDIPILFLPELFDPVCMISCFLLAKFFSLIFQFTGRKSPQVGVSKGADQTDRGKAKRG